MTQCYMFLICSAIRYGTVMGTKRFETVFEYSQWGFDTAVECRCGHQAGLKCKPAVAATCSAARLPRPRHPMCIGVQISCLCHPEIQNIVRLYRFLGLI